MVKITTHLPKIEMVPLLTWDWDMASIVPLNPLATLATESTYSKITDQPITNAKNSPLAIYVYVYADPAFNTKVKMQSIPIRS